MRKTMVGMLTALALGVVASPSSVEAGRYCGAASYSCCPTQACQPAACYTTCRVERQQCERTVYSYVQEPQQYMVSRTVYDNTYEDVAETRQRGTCAASGNANSRLSFITILERLPF